MKELNPTKTEYKTPPMRFYKTALFILSGIAKILFRTKVKGKENMPENGAVFVCSNHISNWDAVLVATSIKRPVFFMAKKELFSVPVLKNILNALGAFSVDRDNPDVGAIRKTFTHIKNGEPVGIFPQGHRCDGADPRSMKIKNGVGMMVHHTRATALPVSVYSKKYKIMPFRKAYITIGKPIPFEEYNSGEKSQEEYQRISDYIFTRVCDLNDEAKREAEGRK